MALMFWLMLLPLMAEGIAIQIYVDDVISTWLLADVIANSVMWLMLLPLGRCYSQWVEDGQCDRCYSHPTINTKQNEKSTFTSLNMSFHTWF